MDLSYSGKLPKYEDWEKVTEAEYDAMTHEFKNKPWNFKEEAIKYCQLDCKSLHELMGVFNNLIMKQFNVNVSKCLTIGALAMRIFKSNFMLSLLPAEL